MNANALVMVDNGIPVTTSLRVAEFFGKRHSHVLRAIQSLDCSKEFSERNFGLAEYLDEQGKPRPMYEMTKNGFVFLVMGFTGKQAAKFKEDYIAAFDEMHDFLLKRGMSLIQRYNFTSLRLEKRKDEISSCARNMRYWQNEKPEIMTELQTLEKEIQPHLIGLDVGNA